MSIIQYRNKTFNYAGGGYDGQTETFDSRTKAFVVVDPPILIPNAARIRVVTPPRAVVRFTPLGG